MNFSNFVLKLLHLPRWIRVKFFSILNPIIFRLIGIRLGKNSCIFTNVYLSKHPKSIINIGDNFSFSSGESINPLCRNLRGCITAERSNTVIQIGHHVGMSSPCIWAKEKIVIGNYVNIGGDCIIMDSDAHNLDWKIRMSSDDIKTSSCSPIIIEDNVFIGMRCIILKGVTIGARSVIAAGSVVTKSIPPDCIAGGNPAKVIKYFEK